MYSLFIFFFCHLWALGYFTAGVAHDESVKEEDILEPFVKFETIPVLCFQPFCITFLKNTHTHSTCYMLVVL